MNPLKSEPVITVGAMMALVYLAVAFGAPISTDQQRVMQEQLPVLLPVFIAAIGAIRQMVYAPDTVEQIKAQQFVSGLQAAKEGVEVVAVPESVAAVEVKA
jgi:hypothetical protein